MGSTKVRSKIFTIILDGFGDGRDYPFNAIKKAQMPYYKELCAKFPRAQLKTCGEAVGLPDGIMGNSEVGHMNMGAGRIVYQDLTRISKAIREGEFARNTEILKTLDAAKSKNARVHLMGLFSDAGVHSDLAHLKALIELADSKSVPVTVHLFTDGRDTPPTSAIKYLKEFESYLKKFSGVVIGSVSGRYYAMDRDNRWERVEQAWKALTGQGATTVHDKTGNGASAAREIIEASYKKEVTDEFIVPTAIACDKFGARASQVSDGDAIIFFNFRSDRARELTRAFNEDGFKEFSTGARPKLSRYLCFTQYDKRFTQPVAFAPQNLSQILPQVLAAKGLRQLRSAETEKYAHVTFFFNGGREEPYAGESRILVPSPKDVATYDLKPEMSAYEVAAKVSDQLRASAAEFVLVNFANPDMVGHTGKFDAAVKALKAVDDCLKQTIDSALSADYEILITADHGNIEEMWDEEHDEPHTQHTLNPVPFHYISKKKEFKIQDGILADLAPTILELMNIPQPGEMTGRSLLKK